MIASSPICPSAVENSLSVTGQPFKNRLPIYDVKKKKLSKIKRKAREKLE